MMTTLTGRDLVLDQAARLFLENGYVETTLRDIAAACDLKAGSIYYHFASKAEILSEILEIGIERITAGVDGALIELTQEEPEARLRVAIHGHLIALFEHGPYTAAHVSVFHSAPAEVRAPGIIQRDQYEALWTSLIEALGSSTVQTADLNVARLALFGAMNSTLDWFKPGGSRTLSQVADALADQFLLGVLKR